MLHRVLAPLAVLVVLALAVAPVTSGLSAATAAPLEGPDTDGDGLDDELESILATDPELSDTDHDLRSDYAETNGGEPVDTDGDGIIDALDADSDGDSVDDLAERPGNDDSDNDGIPDYRDDDDDGDLIPTVVEAAWPESDLDGVPNYLDLDSDNDGLADNAVGEGEQDFNGNGLPDFLDNGSPGWLDTDLDNLHDLYESGFLGTRFDTPDSDGDLLGDFRETDGGNRIDSDGDGAIDAIDWDSDDDGVIDRFERTQGAQPADTDHDGLRDYRDPDDDGDNIPTASEGSWTDDADSDGVANYLDTDSDGDGVPDNGDPAVEPYEFDLDCDSDGVPDFLDPDCPTASGEDADTDGVLDAIELALGMDPFDPDSDGDGRDDGFETGNGQDAVDTDADGLIDALDTDSDNDRVPDSAEMAGWSDSDEDGQPDFRDDDDDGDGLPTEFEIQYEWDLDGDGIPNYLDTDSDEDGFLDYDEAVAGSDPYDAGSVPTALHLPGISSIADVGNDQGRRVRVRWARSDLDEAPPSPSSITTYSIYRRVDDAKASREGLVAHATAEGWWDFVLSVPAAVQSQYSALAGTLCDSTGAGLCWSVFFVRAHTASPATFFDSAPDSGFSIDNLAPNVPSGLAVAYGATNRLNWLPSPDADFRYFRVYRGVSAGFVPDPAALIGSTTGTEYADPGAGTGAHYAITAVDFAGNESPAARLDIVSGTGIPGALAEGLRAAPNPFNPSTTLRFGLARQEAVRLVIYDLAGRQVRTLVAAELPAGSHQAVWDGRDDAGRTQGSGVYVARLTAGDRVESTRLGLLK